MKLEDITGAAIYIHSMDYALKCSIIDMKGSEMTISPAIGKCDMIRQNDPLVFMYTECGGFLFKSASAVAVDYKECLVKLFIAEDNPGEERRIFERYPVSIEVSARKKYQNKRFTFLTKNLSMYGLGVVSSSDIEVDDQFDVDLITKKNMLYFTTKIVWKKKLSGEENNYEYGMHITDIDVATLKILDEYLKKAKTMYFDMFGKAK